MNEKLQEAVVEMISKVNDGVDASTALLSAELPDYIVQLLMWHGVKSFSECVFGLLILTSIAAALKLIVKKCKTDKDWDRPELWIPFGFAAIVGSTIGLCMLNVTWVQVWIAPKVWLVEYVATLVK